MKTLKRTWADISLDNLEYNYRSIRAHLPQGTKFLGVMKADAYGHGAVPVSRALADLGAEYLAVSNLEEAVQIRRGEVRLPILILGYTPAEYAANMIFPTSRRRFTRSNTPESSTRRWPGPITS